MSDSSPKTPRSGDDKQDSPAASELTTIDDMRAYLHSRNGVSVRPNDPVFMLHTMHHVFITDYESILSRHNLALTKMIGEAVSGLTEEALTKNLDDQTRLADRTGKIFKAQYRRAKILSMANVLAAFVCIPVLVYRITR